MQFNSYTQIKTCSVAGTVTQVLTGQGVLERIVNNTSTVWSVAVIDDITGTSATIGRIASGSVAGNYDFNCRVSKGIRIVTTGAATINPSLTVVWRQ